jgi:signal transduction histidine kinase
VLSQVRDIRPKFPQDYRDPLLADAGGGHGLTAMRERAQRAGGTARAGPTADGWLVELEVPA